MKLYTTTRAEKYQDGKTIQVTKSQGSNTQINININIDSEYPRYRLHINKREDNSTDIVLVDLERSYPNAEVFRSKIKGK